MRNFSRKNVSTIVLLLLIFELGFFNPSIQPTVHAYGTIARRHSFETGLYSTKPDDISVYEDLGFEQMNYINYTVNHKVEFYVSGASTVDFYFVVFSDHSPYQEVKIVGTSHPITETTTDKHGNHIVVLSNIHLRRRQAFNVTFTFEITIWLIDYEMDPNNIGEYDPSSEIFQEYTKAEEYIESDHPEIVQKAQEIVGSETNAYHMAQAMLDWVNNNIEYEDQEEEMGALWALENRKGDCSEYAFLFTALCRAVGVPARTVRGSSTDAVLDGGTFMDEEIGWHLWAEVYFPNYGWVWIDPAWGWFADNDPVHISQRHSVKAEYRSAHRTFQFYSCHWRYRGASPSLQRQIFEVDVPEVDADNDGLTNVEEYRIGTIGLNPDTDDDGLSDGDEVKTYGTDPLISDSDSDGLTDGEETSLGTSPSKADTDDDLWNDSIDPMPTNFFLPNFIIIAISIGIVGLVVFVRRRRRAPTEMVPPSAPPTYYCPTCGSELIYIPEYQRWYCPNCKKYV